MERYVIVRSEGSKRQDVISLKERHLEKGSLQRGGYLPGEDKTLIVAFLSHEFNQLMDRFVKLDEAFSLFNPGFSDDENFEGRAIYLVESLINERPPARDRSIRRYIIFEDTKRKFGPERDIISLDDEDPFPVAGQHVVGEPNYIVRMVLPDEANHQLNEYRRIDTALDQLMEGLDFAQGTEHHALKIVTAFVNNKE